MANGHAFLQLSACRWAWIPTVTIKQTRKIDLVTRSPFPSFGSIQVRKFCIFYANSGSKPLVERQDKLCTAFVKRVESFYKPAAQYPLCSVVFLMVLKYLKIKRVSQAKSPPANSLGFLWIFALLAFHNAWSFFVWQDTVMNWDAVYFCSDEPSSLQLQRLSVHWPRHGSLVRQKVVRPVGISCIALVYLFQWLKISAITEAATLDNLEGSLHIPLVWPLLVLALAVASHPTSAAKGTKHPPLLAADC